MPFVLLLDDAQRDVRQQGGQDPTLRRPAVGAQELLLGQNASLQECQDEPLELRVTDALPHALHQPMMAHPLMSPSIAHWKGSFSPRFQRFPPRERISTLRCAMAPWTDFPGRKPYETG